MIFVVMCCAPRTPGPLVRQLMEQGAGVVHQVWDEPRRGCWYNFRAALECAWELNQGSACILQDDTKICKGFVPYVHQQFVHQQFSAKEFSGLIQLWVRGNDAPRKPPTQRQQPRLEERPGADYKGNQVSIYTPSMQYYLRRWFDERAQEEQRDDLGHRHGDDHEISCYLRARKLNYYIHFPGLAQHVGADSIVAPGMSLDSERVSHHYVGDDFDARSLL